jgi:outer membrane protein assembly factor BamB
MTLPAITDGTIYFVTIKDAACYAIDSHSMKQKWIFSEKPQEETRMGNSTWSIPVVLLNQKLLYFNCNDGRLYALSTEDGKKRWLFETHRPQERLNFSPAIQDGVLYFGDGSAFYAVDALRGENLWTLEIPTLSPGAVVGEVAYFSGMQGHLYAIDIRKRKRIQTWRVREDPLLPPAVADGIVYVAGKDGVYTIDTSSEKMEKRFPYQVSSDFAISDGILYFGTTDHYFRAIDIETGEEKWRMECDAWGSFICSGWIYILASRSVYVLHIPTAQEHGGEIKLDKDDFVPLK